MEDEQSFYLHCIGVTKQRFEYNILYERIPRQDFQAFILLHHPVIVVIFYGFGNFKHIQDFNLIKRLEL